MKILIFSLLRLGDTLMHRQIRNGLKAKYPTAKFTWMVNDNLPSVVELIDPNDEVQFFPRKSLQDIALLKTVPITAPEGILREWISILQDSTFDLAINLSHDKVSGYLMSLVNAEKKTGLQWDGISQWAPMENSWLRYLNDHMQSGSISQYHYCDLLLQIAEVPAVIQNIRETKSDVILLQPFTSDQKKNWSLENWRLLQLWIEENTSYEAIVVGAPFEEAQLKKVFPAAAIKILGLAELQNEVKNSKMVISGDTAIIHLAALVGTQSLTLSLGSSDFRKTSAFGPGHFVLSPNTKCKPCHHSKACTQTSHLCEEDLPPEYAQNLLDHLLNDHHPLKWKKAPVSAFRTGFRNGFLYLEELSESKLTMEKDNEGRSSSLL
ncbi:MAG: glycosyltransferase family 9 protein [Bdellovibrionota bacterium]